MNPSQPGSSASDRRQLPRIDIILPAALRLKDGGTANVRVFNISREGLQIRCTRAVAARLCPSKRLTDRREMPLMQLRFLVPLLGGRTPVEVRCRMRHLNLLPEAPPETEVAIGLEFRRFPSEKYLQRFIAFIEEQLVPVEDYEVYLRGQGPSGGQATARDPRQEPDTAAAGRRPGGR